MSDHGGRRFRSYFGVDFSGAKLAGRFIWVARIEPSEPGDGPAPFRLVSLACLEDLCGTAERSAALDYLVRMIAASEDAVWAMDFPFGLPIEVLEPGALWDVQHALVRDWGDDAYGLGLECLRRAKQLGGPMHIRRLTDAEAKAPFDCYHYRIIYQTFFGMRDVLGPLRNGRGTAVLPFHYRRLSRARRVLVEACPSSTLKRLGLPHQNYKQPQGGPLTPKRRATRRSILGALSGFVSVSDRQRRVVMRNPGGDALDALIAAVGVTQAWADCDHRSVARHPRYPREGRLYV